jgi:5-methylcytosine-specific restriction endonuclease McrA
MSASHPPKCGCKPCRDKRRRGYIKNYYRRLPPDKRATLSNKRRAKSYGVAHEEYSRSEIMRRWNYRCCYCDARAEHLDHVHPLSKGGADAAHNMVPACASCNLSKGAKPLAEWAETFGPEPRHRLTHPSEKDQAKGLPWN